MSTERPRLPRCYVYGSFLDDRKKFIREHCYETMMVQLEREPRNPLDSNAVAVWAEVPGIFSSKRNKIGYLKRSHAERVAKVLDAGHTLWAQIDEIYDRAGRRYPVVRLNVGYDDWIDKPISSSGDLSSNSRSGGSRADHNLFVVVFVAIILVCILIIAGRII